MSRVVKILCFITLIGLWVYSMNKPAVNIDEYLASQGVQEYNSIHKKPDIYSTTEGFVGFSSYPGYSGPIYVATYLDADGVIKSVKVVADTETPVYMGKLVNKRFYDQFVGKFMNDAIHLNSDIDSISGATISCRAVTESSKVVAHALSINMFDGNVTIVKDQFAFGTQEAVLLGYFILVILFSTLIKRPQFRIYMLVASIVIIGFWLNRSLSLPMVSGVLFGYLPSLQLNLLWYIMVAGSFILVLVAGRNIYCTWICPFGGVQELSKKVTGGFSYTFGSKLTKWIRTGRDIVLFLLLALILITKNPSAGGIEPFGTFFGLNGTAIPWAVCFIAILGSLFYPRFWCKTFCPIGAMLDMVAKIKRVVLRKKLAATPPRKAVKADTFLIVAYIMLLCAVVAVVLSELIA